MSSTVASAGKQHYDNFLVDAASNKRFLIRETILPLALKQNSSQGQIGLSDHDPIVLTIEDVTSVRKKKSAASSKNRRAATEREQQKATPSKPAAPAAAPPASASIANAD